MSDWLDLELSHHLAPAEAPEELWNRICAAPQPQPARNRSWAAWPIAAIVMILIAVGTLFLAAKGKQPTPAAHHLALQQPRTHDSTCVTCHTNL